MQNDELAGLPVERRIDLEQVRLIHEQGPLLVSGALLCALVLTTFLWQHLPGSGLLIWLLVLSINAMVRLWVIHTYRHADAASVQTTPWGTRFWSGALSAGVIWGVWPLFFYDAFTAEYLLLMSVVFAGMVAVSAASGSVYLPAFWSFSVPLLLPLALFHLMSGTDSLELTGVLLLIFLAINWFLATRGNGQYRELIRSRFENHDLMASLAAEKANAERAVIAKSRFLAAASHDLRQPLHAMGLFLSALRHRETDPRQLDIMDDMAKSSDALNGLFNSLLDVSRLDADIIVVEPSHIRVQKLFDGLRAQFRQQAAEKGLELILSGADCVVHTDNILFERVLRNLVSNAIQYTEHGHVQLCCRQKDEHKVCVSLCDTGIGIPAAASEEVFTEYYQLNNPERDRRKGLGLGLSIVRRLCKLLEVDLSMSSETGRGTRFELEVHSGSRRELPPEPLPAATRTTLDRCVLVIDDEQQVLSSMRHVLDQWGCEVLLAESARDALKSLALTGLVPDLILSDYRLRDHHNGVDAVAAVRESLDRAIPAVIVTGDTTPRRLKDVAASHLQVLHKPVSTHDLRAILDRLPAARKGAATEAAEPMLLDH